MAELSKKVIKKGFDLCTIKEFRTKYASNVTPQAIDYAIENDLVDYVYIGPRVRAIVLTEKSKNYSPNSSPRRDGGTHKSTMEV